MGVSFLLQVYYLCMKKISSTTRRKLRTFLWLRLQLKLCSRSSEVLHFLHTTMACRATGKRRQKEIYQAFSEIYNDLLKENSTVIRGGDFNVDLLKLPERDKYQEFFYLFVSNGATLKDLEGNLRLISHVDGDNQRQIQSEECVPRPFSVSKSIKVLKTPTIPFQF